MGDKVINFGSHKLPKWGMESRSFPWYLWGLCLQQRQGTVGTNYTQIKNSAGPASLVVCFCNMVGLTWFKLGSWLLWSPGVVYRPLLMKTTQFYITFAMYIVRVCQWFLLFASFQTLLVTSWECPWRTRTSDYIGGTTKQENPSQTGSSSQFGNLLPPNWMFMLIEFQKKSVCQVLSS